MRIGPVLVSVLAFLLCSGFDGQGRFPKEAPPGDLGPAIRAVRSVLEPVYALRGILFQTRLELIAWQGGPAGRAAVADWLSMSPADAGWVAERIDHMAALEGKKRDKVVIDAAKTLGGPLEQNDVKRSLRALLKAEALKPGQPPPADEASLLYIVGDGAARKSFTSRLGRIPKILEQFKDLPDAVKKVGTRSAAAFAKIKKNANKAGDDGEAAGTLAVDALVIGFTIPELIEDVKAVPTVLQSIVKEGQAIAQVLPKVQEKLAGVSQDEATAALSAATLLGQLDGQLPTADTFAGLGGLLGGL
jgi:hypothetical protein